MKRYLILLAIPVFIFSQVDIFGYYEAEYDQAKLSGTVYNYGYNKLRLDFVGSPDDNVTIGANINILKYNANTTWNLLDFLPEELWKPVFQPENLPKEYWINEVPVSLQDTLYLDNLYLRANFKRFDLTIGKQQISPGTGYAWNPTDIFNFKQLLDPTYEQTGVNAVRLEIPFGVRSGLDLIYSPDTDWEASAKMVQAKTGIGRFDVTAMAAEYNWSRTVFDPLNFNIINNIAKRQLFGASVVGELAGIGLWVEGAFNSLEKDNDFFEGVIGADYTFESGLYILMEYLYNENGGTSLNALDFDSALQYFNGELHSLMQQYVFNYVNYPLTDLIQFSLINFANLDDNSAAINPQISWDAFQDVAISFMLSYYIGETDTEFGLQDNGWRIRIRGYF